MTQIQLIQSIYTSKPEASSKNPLELGWPIRGCHSLLGYHTRTRPASIQIQLHEVVALAHTNYSFSEESSACRSSGHV